MTNLHINLIRYRTLPILVTIFLMYHIADMTEWYKLNFDKLDEWQNAPIIVYLSGLITGLVAVAKIGQQTHDLDGDGKPDV